MNTARYYQRCKILRLNEWWVVVTLECTEQKESGVPGMSRYTTMKNRRNTPDRLEIKKYNKYLRRMTLHKEIKK